MNVTARFAMISAAVFAAVCLAVAITGFSSLAEIVDPAQVADARGFAWFWMFLAGVAVVFGVLSWRIDWTQHDDSDA